MKSPEKILEPKTAGEPAIEMPEIQEKAAEKKFEGSYETPEGQIGKWLYIYKVDGKEVKAEVELLNKAMPTGEKTIQGADGTGALLKKYILHGERDGQETSSDILEMINPHGTKMIVSNEKLKNYHYNDEEKVSVSPPLTSLLDLGAMFHEQGHAAQHQDEKFEYLNKLYSESKQLGVGGKGINYRQIKELVGKIRGAVLGAKEAMGDKDVREHLAEIKKIDDRIGKETNAKDGLLLEKGNIKDEQTADLKRLILGSFNIMSSDQLKEEIERMALEIEIAAPERYEDLKKEISGELISKMEVAGFRLSTAKEPEKTAPTERTIAFGEETEKTLPPQLMIADIKDPYVARSLFKQFKRIWPENIKIDYRKKEKRLIAEFLFITDSGEYRTVILDLAVSDGDYADYKSNVMESDLKIEELSGQAEEKLGQIDQMRAEMKTMVKESGLGEIMAMPARMLERNATYHAFRWARQLRDQSGIDLFKLLDKEGDGPLCTGAEGEDAGIYKHLKNALKTYGAEKNPRRGKNF